MINRLKLQLILALFWFASAYLATAALIPWEWAWRCAWLNLIVGMVSLLLITRTDRGERLFYQGPADDEPGSFIVLFLWSIPVIMLIWAILWWLMRWLGLFNL